MREIDEETRRLRLAIEGMGDEGKDQFYQTHQEMMRGVSNPTTPRTAQLIAWLARIGMMAVVKQAREDMSEPQLV